MASKPRSTRRKPLLLLLIAAFAVGGIVLAFHGNSSASAPGHVQKHQAHKAATHTVHRQASRVAARRTRRTVKKSHAARAHTTKRHVAKTASAPKKVAARRKPSLTGQQKYAARLRPVLDYSTRLFDQAAEAVAASGSLSGMADVCGQYSTQVSLASDRAEGVPHPYRWYTRAGRMHHNLMGQYHFMAGALASCQLAAGNGDDQSASTAKTDIAQADRQMHSTDAWVHWLARR